MTEHVLASAHRCVDPAPGAARDEPLRLCVLPSELDRHRSALAGRLGALLVATGTGDRAAFTEFYRLTSSRVFGLAVRILHSHATAEEVTQEVYLQVWSTADQYDTALSSPVGWLMTLAHRRAVDRVRAEAAAAVRDQTFAQAGRDHDVVAESVAEQAGLDYLGVLTTTQRAAITLAYYTGRTYREVADQLSVPLPTIKTRIRDGLNRLEKCLSGEGADG
ncbi:sigma-70 family RNA polymerase sigma factor [Nocardia sp. NPDC051321]|uniref:sigma-70 family RNA polymerase sigma factor n=1 Tax=Nocardia sp. NPDC051321 TaxID=3364323 RepID=UPI00379515FC